MATNEKPKICPVCGKEIREGSSVTVCPQCGVVHHMRCWEINNGCYTRGCIAGGKHGIPIEEIAHMQHSGYSGRTSPLRSGVEERRIVKEKTDRQRNHGDDQRGQKQRNDMRDRNDRSTAREGQTSTAADQQRMQQSKYIGYLPNGRMDEFMQALIQNNIYYYDQKFAMMNMSGSSVAWNWASFFLGAYWMVYRKMYLNTLFLWLINIGIGLIGMIPVVGWIISGILGIGLWVCMGLFGNVIYKKHVEKIYEECRNLSYDHRKQECVTKGGTSGGAVVIYILIVIFGGVIAAFLLTTVFAGLFATSLLFL